MAATARGAFPHPLGGDPPDTDGDIRRLAERSATVVALFDHSDPRPLAGVPGRFHRHPVTGLVSYDHGTAWQEFDFLPRTGKAADSELLDGLDSAAFEPKRTEVFVPASAMSAITGAPSLGVLAVRHPVWLMDPATTENVAGGWNVPSGWASVVVDLLWSKPGVGAAGDVRWQVVLDHADDLGSLAVTGPFKAQTAATPDQNALRRTRLGSGSGGDVFAVTPGGYTNVRVQRLGADAADTFTEDVALLGARIVRVS